MEKATRERLTGAVILVAVLAIAVPELLSGPGDEVASSAERVAEAGPPMATYDLAMDASDGAAGARQQELAAAPAARAEQIAQAVPPPVTAPATLNAAMRDAPAHAAEADADADADVQDGSAGGSTAQSPAVAAASTADTSAQVAGQWWVQLGSFSSQQNADKLARDLRAKGFDIEVAKMSAGGKQMLRVRAGPVPHRAAAAALRQQLEALGNKGASLVAP